MDNKPKYSPDIHHRRSIRLKRYDYSQAGAYFITLCIQNRECLFGEIIDGEIRLNDAGRIVLDAWRWIERQYDYISLDEFIVMPNHLHGILVIDDCRGGARTALTGKHKPIGRLVGAYKTVSTRRINEIRKTPSQILWQRNYYEYIIRDDNDLNRIREYIVNNPMNWENDEDYR